MIIGIPTEIKNNENRVALTPAAVHSLILQGHQVIVEKGAGLGSSYTDEEYQATGATLSNNPNEVWQAEMVMKVKEPLAAEYHYFRPGLILFTYLHLAPVPELTEALLKNKVTGIAYETIQEADRSLPLLVPMSEVAGRMSVQIGSQFLEKIHGGSGILLGGVPGVTRGEVAIIGGGNAGQNAARVALGFGARVTILDISAKRLAQLDDLFAGQVDTKMSSAFNIAEATKKADLVIGAVLIPGAKAPKLVTEDMVKAMKPGSVLVDIAVDQGGIFATTDHTTTHDDPVYIKHGVVHYAVANMPGAVPKTSTEALSNVTVAYAIKIANGKLAALCAQNKAIAKGVNTYNGLLTNAAVADAQGKKCTDIMDAFKDAVTV